MASREPGGRPLVGRAVELAAVHDVLAHAAEGRAGALLVSGEAGVGKTALVRSAADEVAGRFGVLWATCLPLTSLTVPFLPLTTALREWTAGHGGAAPGLDPLAFDAWLDDATLARPMLLVVDDLHWADQSTLDVLTYVLALPPRRRLAVVTTLRSGETGPGHALHRWLADARRQPGFAEVRLDRLDRPATADQLHWLLGRPPRQALLDAVYDRTGGNAYLNVLLARGIDPDADTLPTGLPSDLRDALARAWHGLSPAARGLTNLVAVAGGPIDVATLESVSPDAVELTSVREAVDAGVLVPTGGDRYWFAHPLLAEVLEEGLLPDERRALHAAFAAEVKRDGDGAIAVADHHYRAGNAVEAFAWSLRGAEVAERAGGATEGLRLLRRALHLLASVPDAGLSRLDLLARLRAAADRAGDQEAELAAVEDLLTLVDRERDPLVAAELLIRRKLLCVSCEQPCEELGDMREALRLTAPHPTTMEHALAMSELSQAEWPRGIPGAQERSREAVRLARLSGSPRALAYALFAAAEAHRYEGADAGRERAREAQRAALQAHDYWVYTSAAGWSAATIGTLEDREALEDLRRSRRELIRAGAPHTYLALLCAWESLGMVVLGDWRDCADRLRLALTGNPGALADADARLVAAQLAGRQGRLAEGRAHYARAEELFTVRKSSSNHPFDATRAELALAAGELDEAVEAALTGLRLPIPPNHSERLAPISARALADAAQRARDRGMDPAASLRRLAQLRHEHPQVSAPPLPGEVFQRVVSAMQALYDAEVTRAYDDVAAGNAWERAATACRGVGLAWDEAYASWRTAEALLPDRARRREAVDALRRAYELALDLEAAPVLSEVEALARDAHVSLGAPAAPPPAADGPFAGLTPRQREVLALVVAGRTYGEIARALFVAEKTVSSHISAILDKTGCANRVELAQLVRRLNPPDASEGRQPGI